MAEETVKRGKGNENSGRKFDQKMKSILVYLYLLQRTDSDHFESGEAIAEYLQENFGISAERRSVYRDIQEINKALLAHREGITLAEAEEMIEEDESEKIIQYQNRKGFYVAKRQYEEEDIRLLAECVYTAKFITEKQSRTLLDILSEFVSEHQAEKLRHDAFMTDRSKSANDKILGNIRTIHNAMIRTWDGLPHTPEQIKFKYLKYEIGNINQQVERRHGSEYIVSPYHFLINEGNYYLLAYEKNKIKVFRVDRMSNVKLTGIPRDGEEEFNKIDLKSYAVQHFSMFSGEERHVTIQAIHPLLDVMVERFGKDKVNAIYSKVDDKYFRVTVKVNISDQFFGWLLGFGKKVKLVSPADVVEDFTAYIDKIREAYNEKDSNL